jgi:hypothetical protein
MNTIVPQNCSTLLMLCLRQLPFWTAISCIPVASAMVPVLCLLHSVVFAPFRYTAAKRFGLEGCETLIPGMKAMIDRITDMECKSIVIGMPHRGEAHL